MIIKIREITKGCFPKIIKQGDWIDLIAAETVVIGGPYSKYHKVEFTSKFIPLGIAIELPKGYEAIINPRSSIFKNYNCILANSQGVIDNTYCGNNDEWKFQAIALSDTVIKKGERICQFRIQLSQNATFVQKMRWLFNNRIEFKKVDKLKNKDRNGFGSTGK